MKWIKCSERLPEYEQWVLVLADNRISIGQYLNWNEREFWNSQSSEDSCCGCSQTDFKVVTDWMPLPPFPGKEHCEAPCQLCEARHKSNHEVKK